MASQSPEGLARNPHRAVLVRPQYPHEHHERGQQPHHRRFMDSPHATGRVATRSSQKRRQARTDSTQTQQHPPLRCARRRLLYKESHIAGMNERSRSLACSALNEPHGRHELLNPGTRQRIEAGESAVRSFPRTSATRGMPTITPNTQCLTIIPSCHVVGHRRRIWGFPSYLIVGPILVAAQLNPPRIDDLD